MVRFGVPLVALLMSLAAAAPASAQGFSTPGQAPGAQNAMPPAPAGNQNFSQPQPQQPPQQASPLPPLAPPTAAQQPPAPMAPPPVAQQPVGQSPGFNQPNQPQPGFANPGGQPVRQNYADELTDFGVPPQSTLQTNVGSPTPLTIPGGHVITTNEMMQAVGSNIVFIDVWDVAAHPTLPGAVAIPGAGRPGNFNDAVQNQLWNILSQLSHMQPQQPLVFFCTGSQCWESYNAALRAVNMGFKMVLWYRGGLAAWQAAGLQMVTPGQGQGQQQQQSRPGFGQ